MVKAVGLDGREIDDEPDQDCEPETVGTDHDILIFDRMPRWARDALREEPKYNVKAREIAPHINSGNVTRFNIGAGIAANDAYWRAENRKKDIADGLA